MKGKNNLILVCFLFLGFSASYGQSISTASFYATEDAYTRSGASYTGVNYGASNELIVTSAIYSLSPVTYSVSRSFVKFDLSSIPSNAIVTSAKFRLRIKSESLAASGSTDLYLDLANSTWDQSTITHSSGISNNTITSTVTTSDLVTVTDVFGSRDYREFEAKSQVQAIVEGRIPNYGWRIRRNPESGRLSSAIYYSMEHIPGNTFFYPMLEVKYYIPMSVSSAIIVLPTTTTSGNGSISPTIVDGSSSTKTYAWYSSSDLTTPIATTLNLVNRNSGWYGLKVTGTGDASDVSYYGFLLGAKCSTITVTFNPDGNYVDDAQMNNLVTGSGTTAIFYDQQNNGTLSTIAAAEIAGSHPYYIESLLRFRLWFDPNLTYNSALVTFYGNGHAPTDRINNSNLRYTTGSWAEMSAAYSNKPTISSTSPISVAGLAAGNGNRTVNITPFVNLWKIANTQNYGMFLQLISYAGSNTLMQFNSSDAAAGSRPSLSLNITSNDCNTNDNLFYIPKESIGPEVADLLNTNKKLRIRYKDYFDTDVNLQYTIKGITDDAVITVPTVTKPDHTNWITIDLTSAGLVTGNVYLLELTDNSGKKEYLKFKVI